MGSGLLATTFSSTVSSGFVSRVSTGLFCSLALLPRRWMDVALATVGAPSASVDSSSSPMVITVLVMLIDGNHDQATTAKHQKRFISMVYKYLDDNNVMLEGTLLKPSMTVSGVDCENKPTPAEVASKTVETLESCIPPAMPGVTFLSGGISEEDSSIYLNEINKIDRKGP